MCDHLLAAGHSVVGIDAFVDYYPRAAKERNLSAARRNSQFKFIEGDLLSTDIDSLLGGADWVFHQAAQAGVRASWGDYFSSYTANNVLATQRLLDGVRRTTTIQKVVYASSSSIYGNAESYPTREEAMPRPVSPYGVTKLAAEHLMVLYATEFGVPTVSLRYFTVYGPRQRPDMAFHRFIKAGLRGDEIVVYGDGEQSRDFTFISDIVGANVAAAEFGAPGTVFNLGGGTQATVNDVLGIVESHVGPLTIRREARQAGDARHTRADTTRALRDLRFRPSVTLEEGIGREVEWLRAELTA
ncbi:MAG: dTDP-glucose 4,6-dehydratase [Pseudomonadota bacterium]